MCPGWPPGFLPLFSLELWIFFRGDDDGGKDEFCGEVVSVASQEGYGPIGRSANSITPDVLAVVFTHLHLLSSSS